MKEPSPPTSEDGMGERVRKSRGLQLAAYARPGRGRKGLGGYFKGSFHLYCEEYFSWDVFMLYAGGWERRSPKDLPVL